MNPLIENNPAVMMGKPVIRGTRLTVEGILEKLQAGETTEQVLAAHPGLTREAVLYVLENIHRGQRDADNGDSITLQELRREMQEW